MIFARLIPRGDHTHLQGALAGGGQGQRQVHEGFEGAGLAVAGHALHRGLELALEQSHDDGLIQQLVFAPGQISRCLIIQVIVLFLLVSFPVVGLNTAGGKIVEGSDVARCNKCRFQQQKRISSIKSQKELFLGILYFIVWLHFVCLVQTGSIHTSEPKSDHQTGRK